ncbi:MAG: TonB-dependent receptor [Bryobacter sp.]|nr:TonB-dependent receptor [Bryobacter sp.]
MKIQTRVATLLLILVSLAFGQSDANKGTIVGRVFDPNSASVAGAKIVVQNTNTGISREITSGNDGAYRVVSVDPGVYEITASSSGFAESKLSGVVVNVGSTITVDVRLSLQATSTTVEVGETLLQDAVPVASQLVNSTAITNLPINGRRFQDFVLLTPTAVVEGSSRNQISFAGQRGINSNIMLDGTDYNQPFFGGIRGGERSTSIITVPQTAIAEFQVVATGYSAEYGRSTGGIMNTITKSGTNEVHGEAFYQIRHRSLSARNPIFNVRPSETLQQYGGGVGGPIKQNKLFWFAAAEAQNSKIPRQVVIPSLNNITVSAANQEVVNFLRAGEGPFEQTNRAYALTAKTDYAFDKGHRLTLRYNFSDSNEVNAVTVGAAVNPFTNGLLSNEGQEKDRIHNGTMQYTHIFSPNIVNDFRFTGSYEERPRLANSNAPSVTLQNVAFFGARSFLPTTQFDYRWQFVDAMTITRDKHTIKVGFDFNYLPTGQLFGFNQFGSFFVPGTPQVVSEIAGGNGTNGANRFDTRTVSYTRQIGNLAANYNVKQIAAFAQDTFRVSEKLTLDFGLRWDGQINPAVEANNTAALSRVEGVLFPIGNVVSPRSINNTMNQFQPRFGFAYRPFSDSFKTVIRGHTGVFYAATPLLTFSGPTNNFRLPPGDLSISVGGGGAVKSVYQSFLEAGLDLNRIGIGELPVIPVDVVQRAAAISAGGTARDPFVGASYTTTAPNFRNPRSFQVGLGTETEWFRNFTAGVQFNYVNTVNLNRNRNYNLPAPVINPNDQRQVPDFALVSGGSARRPVQEVNALTVREPSARSMYRAMTLSAQYRTRKAQFQAFYTLAQSYSDDDGEREAAGFAYVNSFDLKPEYHFSALDIRHNFTANAVYSLPFGFQISGIVRARSGLPINPVAGSDLNRDGNNNDRPYFGPGEPFLRNYFRNRGFTTTDMRLLKNFNLKGERVRIQFSVEAFNLFDVDNVVFGGITNIYGPGFQANGATAAANANFLRLRNADGSYFNQNQQLGSPRQLQGGLRLFF